MASRRGFLLAAIYGIVAASLPLAVWMLKPGKTKSAPTAPRPGQRFTVSLASAPFPYDGPNADGNKPFYDARDPKTRQRAHTTGDGTVLPEHPHYTDDRVLLPSVGRFRCGEAVPDSGVLPWPWQRGRTRTVATDFDLPGQIDASGRNMVLIAPQLALEAPDSSPGKLGMPDGLKNLLDEAAEKFAERTGSKRDEKAFRQAPVILSAFSGGYRAVAFSLARGGLGPRLKGVLLLDAIYGDVKLFSQWILQHWHDGFFVSLYGPSTVRCTPAPLMKGAGSRRRA